MNNDRFGMWAVRLGAMAVLGITGSGAVYAQDAAPAPHAYVIGDSANQWLALQVSGTAAAPARPMPGAEAGAAYDRYMKSFEAKIPASFGSTLGNAGSSSPGGNLNSGGLN